MSSLPDLISNAQTTEQDFLRHIFVRDQMAEWSKAPLIMAKADGVHYWDVHGKRYLDALSGIYVVSVGHNNRRVIDAVRRQLDTLHFSPPMHGTNPVAVQLATLLAQITPGDLDAVKFQCGGSEVTEAAIKLARQYHKLTGNPGKYKIISRYLSWHGSTMGSLSASGLKGRKTVNEPLAPGFLHVFPPTCYRCPFGKSYPDCGITCATIVDQVIQMEDAATVAAVMVEPIGHTGGIIDPPPEYLPLLRDICTKNNVLLVFDEIITSFRIARGDDRCMEVVVAELIEVLVDAEAYLVAHAEYRAVGVRAEAQVGLFAQELQAVLLGLDRILLRIAIAEHLHVHVVPRRRKDGLRGFFWPRVKYGDGEAAQYASALRASLQNR